MGRKEERMLRPRNEAVTEKKRKMLQTESRLQRNNFVLNTFLVDSREQICTSVPALCTFFALV